MKTLKKIKLNTIVGLLAGATLVYFNVRHALNDYGVRDNEKLHPEVMAQANSSGGSSSGRGSGSGSGSGGGSSTGQPQNENRGDWVTTLPKTYIDTYYDSESQEWVDRYLTRLQFVCDATCTNTGTCGATRTITDRIPIR